MNYLRHILLLTLSAFYRNKATMDNEDINVIVSLHRCWHTFKKL